MQHRVVEGEPGIFPEPIAAGLRAIFRPPKSRRRPVLGLIVLALGAAVALVPFHQSVHDERIPWMTYSVDCGVPARTAVRKVDPHWRTYAPGAIEGPGYVAPSNPVPACFTPARHRALLGAALAVVGVLIVAIAWQRIRGLAPSADPAQVAAARIASES